MILISNYIISNGELYHYGVKGMKWGVRRYRSNSITASIAKRQNRKVDEGFDKWREGAKNRDTAIDLGKKATAARFAYERNRSDKNLKKEYSQANKAYKEALAKNTTYRKGTVRAEVGKDASRKYLSEAKKVKKELDKNPTDKALNKRYNDLMSKHDIERAKARRAQQVGAKRSHHIAAMKRTMTVAMKSAATSAVIAGGVYAVNQYMKRHNVTLNGRSVKFSDQKVGDIVGTAKKVKDVLGFMY